MPDIVDTIDEDIVRPVGPPLRIRLCNIEFLDEDSPQTALACIVVDEKKREMAVTYMSSHANYEEDPGRIIFQASMESGDQSRFRELVFLALKERRGITLNGRVVSAYLVERWCLPPEQWSSLADILRVMRQKDE